MSKLSEARKKLQNNINTIKGVVDRYPVLQSTTDILLGKGGSIDFVVGLLSSLGVTQEELMNKVCEWLAGKKFGNGVLDKIEESIKAAILLNIKNMFTCTVDPIIPDSMFREFNYGDIYNVGGQGIELNLDAIDIYGVLDNNPISLNENVFYFDTVKQKHNTDICELTMDSNALINKVSEIKAKTPGATSFYYTWEESNNGKKTTKKTSDIDEAINKGPGTKITIHYYTIEGYSQSDVWKSQDFNAFLWYVINKGSKVWDNRVNFYDKCKNENVYNSNKDNFFEAKNGDNINITDDTSKITVKKKNIIDCEYVSRSNNSFATNVLRVYVNKDEYYHKRSFNTLTGKKLLNKTIFEFNYDYIYSLKLFDTKTLIANIVNSLMGFSMTGYFTKVKGSAAGVVGTIVDRIMNAEDDVISDDYFTFSNDEYNDLLEQADLAYNGQYKSNNETGSLINVNTEELLDIINSIDDDDAEYISQETKISNVFKDISVTLAQNPEVSDSTKFSFGTSIVQKMLKLTVTEIVMQTLSPKVMILYAINKAVMGDINYENYKVDYIDFIIKNYKNLIFSIVKSVNNIITELLLDLLNEKIKPLIAEYTKKVALEKSISKGIMLYNMIKTCYSAGSTLYNDIFGDEELKTAIDNVNYADIIKDTPEN